MGFFDRLFKSADPTRDWPAAGAPAPQVSFDRSALETLGASVPFGAELDAARVLGRPDAFTSDGKGQHTLTYARWGVTLEFEGGRFVQVAFLIDASAGGATTEIEPADARGPDGLRLSPSTTQAELVERFGTPSRVQTFDEETILYFTGVKLCSEFQVEADRLTRWDVYLN